MAVVIGRRATRVPREQALEHVLGYTCANDVTARDLQNRGYQVLAREGVRHLRGDRAVDRDRPRPGGDRRPGLAERQLKQDSTTAQLIFGVAELIEYVANIMTLLPGDIISTGTPSGIGPLAAGDVFTVKVAGVGELTNPVENR